MSHFRQTMLRRLGPAALIAPAVLLVTGCGGLGTSSGVTPTSMNANARANTNSRVTPNGMTFTFTTLDNEHDPTFNQLLGIDDKGKIVGYFGIGTKTHPNKGYTIVPPYAQKNYTSENFPGSMQTQVTAIDQHANTAGFWVDNAGVNFGFVNWTKGVLTTYRDPHTGGGTVNQVLGINDSGIAVGFYTDGKGINHGFEVNQSTGVFTPVNIPGGTNVTVSGINDRGDITGFYTNKKKVVVGFIREGTVITTVSYPMSGSTTPLGINIHDSLVGAYTDSASAMHGFLLMTPVTTPKWQSIDDPNGVGTTTINGLNDKNDLVGFYVDTAGNTDGMLATP
jgi:hypothetical protein